MIQVGQILRQIDWKKEDRNMIDHVILTVSDFERSVAFYTKVLKPLGITNFTDYEGRDGHPDLKVSVTAKELFSGSKKENRSPSGACWALSRKTMPR